MRCGSVTEVRSTVLAALSGFCLVALLCSCFEEEESEQAKRSEGNALDRRERIRQLELDVETLKWENARLFLKIRSVDGSSLVRDKLTGLWHFDVERTPYTGRATENYSDGSPKAEASFLKGKKDGVERFWYANGLLKEESQWFDGLANGIIRTWDKEGGLIRAVRYKKGELIEVIRD